jgi:spermidine/putrescine transport system substrate-binding protein
MAAGELDVAPTGRARPSRSDQFKGLPVAFVVPEEGAIGWLDGLSIGSATLADNVEAAEAAFIDWMIDPEFYVRWDTEGRCPASANDKAAAALPEDSLQPRVMGDPEVARAVFRHADGRCETREAYLELWQGR